ncbi:MAG: hypothetical protein DCF16_18605 [Alphaproteobacteria bacterium]|nr:MAG: hypothetical protein DCF16_18605 [Alphaproteobacteria bacterium]
MTPFYRNTRAFRVRFLQMLFWAGTLGFVSLALLSYRNGPDPNSWIVGAIMAPIFALCALGMEWYLRCYVTALQASEDGLLLETLATFGRTRTAVPWADIELAGERHDVSDEDDAPCVENTAALLRVRGRDLLIIDTTEDRFDSVSLQRFLRGAR